MSEAKTWLSNQGARGAVAVLSWNYRIIVPKTAEGLTVLINVLLTENSSDKDWFVP